MTLFPVMNKPKNEQLSSTLEQERPDLHQVIPQLNLLQCLSAETQHLTHLLTNRFQTIRHSLDALQHAQSTIHQASRHTFARLNAVLQIKIGQLEDQHQNHLQKSQQRSPERSVAVESKRQLCRSKTCPKKHPNHKDEPQINANASGALEREQNEVRWRELLKSTDRQFFELYVCYLCFPTGRESIWREDDAYLGHMREYHDLEPDFELLVLSKVSHLSGSHYFFKGELRNILGHKHIQSTRICYLVEREKYDLLYFCSCTEPSPSKFCKSLQGIFDQKNSYIQHCCRTHKDDTDQHSHILKRNNKNWKLERNPHFDYSQVKKKYSKVLDYHRKAVITKVSQTFVNNLVRPNSASILELISCYPALFSDKGIQIYALYCEECCLFFLNTGVLFRHIRKRHPNNRSFKQLQIQKFNCAQLCEFGSQLSNQWHFHLYRNRVSTGTDFQESLTPEERNIILAELNMIYCSFISQNNFICGHCKQIFKNNMTSYVLHVGSAHKDLHPLNSHVFIFLKAEDIDEGGLKDSPENQSFLI